MLVNIPSLVYYRLQWTTRVFVEETKYFYLARSVAGMFKMQVLASTKNVIIRFTVAESALKPTRLKVKVRKKSAVVDSRKLYQPF